MGQVRVDPVRVGLDFESSIVDFFRSRVILSRVGFSDSYELGSSRVWVIRVRIRSDFRSYDIGYFRISGRVRPDRILFLLCFISDQVGSNFRSSDFKTFLKNTFYLILNLDSQLCYDNLTFLNKNSTDQNANFKTLEQNKKL
jgi:hypothetical protein